MAILFSVLFLSGIITLLIGSGGDAALNAVIAGADEAVNLTLTLSGTYLMFMGIVGVLKRTGLMNGAAKLFSPVIRFLFPNAGAASASIALTFAADLLGLGNAATPFGIRAMEELAAENPDPARPSYEMCAFIAVNASALQLLPTGVIALRQAAGSAQPGAIVLPSILATLSSFLTAVILTRLLRPGARR